MTDRSVKWFPLVLLSLLAMLTFWLDRKVEQSALLQEAARRHDPDFTVDNFSASSLGKNGVLSQRLSAARMLHYPDDDSTLLVAPSLTLYSPGRADIAMSARRAKLSKDGEDVYLEQSVKLARLAFEKAGEFDVLTEALHANPKRHLADTRAPVVLKDSNMEVHAVGMQFNDETRVLKLLSQVRGVYDKTH